ncbi:MAG: hypothetical protein NW201_05335 [Gemmatimonadales bacterium]|nr:hypothetical protein [Gemmatimonadales bacterium]
MPTPAPSRLAVVLLASIALPLAGQAKPKPAAPKKAEAPKAAAAAPAVAGPVLAPASLKAFKARALGPAQMGGRVSEIALHPRDPYTWYVALGTGGLMKTSDNGASFKALFDREAVHSLGAVAIAPSAPKVLYAGSGEANDRNSSGWGDGVYKSTDGGETWTHTGLRSSRTIARVLVHPTDSNTAWVAATGDLWNWGGERGCYRTTDGGATWTRSLSAPKPWDERAGCGDIVMDPKEPTTLYAALYARRRQPWEFIWGASATDGNDVGGIFKTTDNGATWSKLTNGLPARTGRIGLAVSASDPRIVYALVQSDAHGTDGIDQVESRSGGVFRSDDAGATWRRVNDYNPRPFYFSQIRVDPTDPNTVYVLGFVLAQSTDGGKTFQEDRSRGVHADLHALVIDPKAPKRLLLGTDGGVYQSYDAGKGWVFHNSFAGGEYYRINVDLSVPYRICGGLQDNLNWVGPSATRSAEGIRNADWVNITGGDGFYCFFDRDDPDLVFAESQQGALHRFHLRIADRKQLRPTPQEGQRAFRFHWNSPLLPSAHDKGAFYLAGNHVFRFTDRGDKWTVISPDLSAQQYDRTRTTGSGAENYGVVYALAESPVRAGMLWAGTDDGRLWLTRDGGQQWTELTANLPAALKGQWLTRLEASAADPEVAYLVCAAYRSGDLSPHAYRTADGGKTWQSVAGDLPANGPVKVLKEDPFNPNVLYAGTEFGLFVSADRGGRWTRLGELPTIPVDDIVVHPRERDLVIATHGRSLYVIDDIRALHDLTVEAQAAPVAFAPPRPALGAPKFPGWTDSWGTATYRGENPPDGALLTYHVKEWTGDGVSVSIAGPDGRTVASLKGPGAPGFQRLAWDLKPTSEFLAQGRSQQNRFVRPGTYKVTLSYGKTKVERELEVRVVEGVETW